MVIFVDTIVDRADLALRLKSRPAVAIPLLKNQNHHPIFENVSVVLVYFGDSVVYAIPIDHTESINTSPDIENIFRDACHLCVPYSIAWKHICAVGTVYDIQLMVRCSMAENLVPEPETLKHPALTNTSIIPVYTLVDMVLPYIHWCWDMYTCCYHATTSEAFQFIQNVTIPTCVELEKSKIYVSDTFTEHYPRARTVNQFVASQYNPYTITHRVTNRFDHVNYSALDKNSGVRSTLVSRFGNAGSMVLIDYESFHLRLIAELIGYTLPGEPVHQFLGKQYFQKETLTDEEYTIGKQITFTLLYGDNRDAGQSIDFFQKIYTFTDNMYDILCKTGSFHITNTPFTLHLSMLERPTPAKAFNYIVQMLESYTSFRLIRSALPLLRGPASKMILYTYDSILLDFNREDGGQLLRTLVTTLEDGGKYPVRVHAGVNYQEMTPITHVIR